MTDFFGKRVNSNSETLDKKITQLQLPTFSNVSRDKTKGKGNDKTKSVQTAGACLKGLLSSHSKEMLTYELASVPMALTSSDGSLSKTNKAYVMHVLEEQEVHRKIQSCLLKYTSMIKKTLEFLWTIWALCKSVHHVLA